MEPQETQDDVPAARAIAPKTRIAVGILIGIAVLVVPAAVYAVQATAGPGWVAPVNAPIWDTFRPPGREYHDGVDFGAQRFVPIRAASAGTVVVRECNAHLYGQPYSCDIDGSAAVRGCGWFIDIAHEGGFITRYCHMATAPLVQLGDHVETGQRIGYLGSSGNSSAPHLHFQTHIIPPGQPIDAEPENAVDPIAFMAARGITLGIGNDEPVPSPTSPETPTPPPATLPHDPPVDVDGDGATDLVVWRPSDGQWYVRHADATISEPIPLGVTTDVPVVADYDGDGLDDLAVWRPSDGRWLVQTSSGAPVSDPVLGTNEDIPTPGDFDGDGSADFAVFQPFLGQWLVRHADGTVAEPVRLGVPGDLPVVGDYDGDGLDDFAVWRWSTGRWLVQASSGADLGEILLGREGDIPTVGDFDGDGRSDYAFYRPIEARWHVQYATATEAVSFPLGAAGDLPVVGDYDGDGIDDLALWRPTDGTWLIQPSSVEQPIEVLHGLPEDVPANRPLWLGADGTPMTMADILARRFILAVQDAAEAVAENPPAT